MNDPFETLWKAKLEEAASDPEASTLLDRNKIWQRVQQHQKPESAMRQQHRSRRITLVRMAAAVVLLLIYQMQRTPSGQQSEPEWTAVQPVSPATHMDTTQRNTAVSVPAIAEPEPAGNPAWTKSRSIASGKQEHAKPAPVRKESTAPAVMGSSDPEKPQHIRSEDEPEEVLVQADRIPNRVMYLSDLEPSTPHSEPEAAATVKRRKGKLRSYINANLEEYAIMTPRAYIHQLVK